VPADLNAIAMRTYSPASRFWANEQALIAAVLEAYPATTREYAQDFAYNWMCANAPD
jgi:hypothetical protein